MANYSTIILRFLLAVSFICLSAPACAEPPSKNTLGQVDIRDNRNTSIDLELEFSDQNGNVRKLRDFVLRNRPFIILPVYFHCPRLCSISSDALLRRLSESQLELGRDYSVLSVSFDPKDNPASAKQAQQKYLNSLEHKKMRTQAWHFLSGAQANIDELMRQIGFNYLADPEGSEFSHASTLVIFTPDGVISRYFYGVSYSERDLRLSLIEAGRGAIGSATDKVLLYCFRFDTLSGKYSLMVIKLVRVISGIIFGILVSALLFMRVRERRRDTSHV
ncbi:MAG: SCO family protein [Deltaproteobacteria bacterium]|nr:SCO family protein [Deltaproteobacteria bacterium]